MKPFIAGRETEKVIGFIAGRDFNPDIWGGVGIQCIDWHPTEPNILAAVTLKTNQLEVWKVDTAEILCILDIEKKLASIQWSPHEQNKILGRTLGKNGVVLIDY